MTTPMDAQTAARYSLRREKLLESTLVWGGLLVLIYLLLSAVAGVGTGFNLIVGGQEGAAQLFASAINPFTGLVAGILVTALLQSSSTSTSIIVGLVAGGLPISTAIPMIMGANIGTTVTNTIVSLGQVREKASFERAFAAATMHDFFNLLAVVILMPLELYFGLFSRVTEHMVHFLASGMSTDISGFNFIKSATAPPVHALQEMLINFQLSEFWAGMTLTIIGVGVIVLAVTSISKLLRQAMTGRARTVIHSTIGRGPAMGILSGTLTTIAVQSSSTTTSLTVPLAGSGTFSLEEIYPFTLGANIGTTITALLASMSITGAGSALALQIALVHLTYNLVAVLVIYSIPWLRMLPLNLARRLASVVARRKMLAFVYVAGVFFLLPGFLIFLTS